MKALIVIMILILVLFHSMVEAQNRAYETDSLHIFNKSELITPITLISLGVIGAAVPQVKKLNTNFRDYVQSYDPHRIRIDDYMQYAPAVTVYALNLFGVKGEHNFVDRTIILATSYLCMGVLVNGIKYTTRIRRPNGGEHNSFPSGHTATVFMGAEFLRMEYRNHPWIGVAGYTVASLVGCSRIYNNKHWVNDVVMGAGIGILSARVGYWVHKPIRNLFPKSKNKPMTLSPYYNGEQVGAAFYASF